MTQTQVDESPDGQQAAAEDAKQDRLERMRFALLMARYQDRMAVYRQIREKGLPLHHIIGFTPVEHCAGHHHG